MHVVIAVVCGMGFALLSRIIVLVLHRRWFLQGFVGDSSVHWAIVRTLRRKPSARWIDEYVIAPEPFSYPTGFHRVAALFPLSVVQAHSWLPNLVIWTVGVGAFAGYASYGASSLLHVDATAQTVLALAFVLLSPSLLAFRKASIAYVKLSARLLGRLATGFAVLLLVVGTTTNDLGSLAAATVAVTLALTSSVFARQVIIFGFPLLALAWWDWRPLAVLGAGTALAVAVGRARFVNGVRHTLIQWRLYPSLTKSSRYAGSGLSKFARPELIRNALKKRKGFGRLATDTEPLRALIIYPEVVLTVVLLLVTTPSLGWHWIAPIVVFTSIYTLTATQRFNHLGEAHRYLEYGLVFLVPVELALLLQSWSAAARIACVAIIATWAVVTELQLIIRGRWLRTLPDRDRLGQFLSTIDLRPGDVVFPVTMRLGADICARVPGVRSFWWQPGIISSEIHKEFVEEYPYLKQDYRTLVERYGVTHVICDKKALARLKWSYDFSDLTPLGEDDRYSAFAVSQPTAPGEDSLQEEQALPHS